MFSLGLPHDLAIAFLGIYTKEMKPGTQEGIWTPMFIKAKKWKRAKQHVILHLQEVCSIAHSQGK